MKNISNYTGRTGNVLSKQLQLTWRFMLVVIATFLFSGNAFAQIPISYCDGNPTGWPLSGFGTAKIEDKFNSRTDDQFTEGSKDGNQINQNAWSPGNANDKGDIINAGAALVDGCVLRFFADRFAVNGDAAIGFWFYKDPNVSLNADGTFSGTHTDGDILIVVNFINGGGTAQPVTYVWSGSTLVKTSVQGCGITNTTTMDVPSGLNYQSKSGPAGKYQAGAFFEGYVNLCGSGIDLCFSRFLVETRNSQSLDASLQDFALGDIDITPAQPLATATDITCTDEESIISVNDPQIGLTYILDGPGIGDPIEITPTAANPDVEFTVDEVGTYSLIAENANGCQSDPYEVEVDADITPIGAPVVSDQERCDEGEVTFTVSSPLNGVIYRWYNSADVLVHTGTSYTTGSLSATTDFTVTATSANGCESIPTEIQARIFAPVIVDAGGPDARCQSPNAQVIALTSATISQGLSGTWSLYSSNPALTSAIITNSTLAAGSVTIPANYTGEIVLRLTSDNPDGPCLAAHADRTITIGPAAVVEAGDPITVCQSATSQEIELTGASVTGGTGTWSIVSSVPASAGNVLSDNTVADGSLTVAANYYGVITLRLTSADPDGAGPCEAASDTRTVTIYQNPTVMVAASASTCVNNVPTVTITATPSGGSGTGYSYVWTVPTGVSNPGNVASFNATVAGTYSVVVTDSRTCSGSGLVVPLFVPCEMLEGCTPGYWKQAQHFGNWGCDYDPTGSDATEFFDVFTGITNYRGLDPDMTLLEALELKGGKFQALARHAAAAILNACADVNYKYTNEEIMSMVRRSFASGNWSIVHNLLAEANEMGCPLGRAELSATTSTSLQGIETTTDQITAYPTPFSDKAIVEFRMAADENYVVNLYDMKGSLVKQLKAGSAKAGELQQVEVDGRGLGEGLYIARMISDSGARSVKLLLKRE